jgi:ribosomal protein S3AE
LAAKQFKGMKVGDSVYRSVISQGASKVLAVTRLIPSDWRFVRIDVVSRGVDSVELRVVRINGPAAMHKGGERNVVSAPANQDMEAGRPDA